MTYLRLGITGNRPQKMPASMHPRIRGMLLDKMQSFKDQGGELVLQGGALGIDQWAADAALAVGLKVHTYVPFPQQPDAWSTQDKEHYAKLLSRSEEVIVFGDEYEPRKFFERNWAIVDDSDIMLAVYAKGASGGAVSTAKHARGKRPLMEWVITPGEVRTFFTPLG